MSTPPPTEPTPLSEAAWRALLAMPELPVGEESGVPAFGPNFVAFRGPWSHHPRGHLKPFSARKARNVPYLAREVFFVVLPAGGVQVVSFMTLARDMTLYFMGWGAVGGILADVLFVALHWAMARTTVPLLSFVLTAILGAGMGLVTMQIARWIWECQSRTPGLGALRDELRDHGVVYADDPPAKASDPSVDRCPECGVHPGERHLTNCDVEECPLCRGQMISCSCVYRVSGMKRSGLKEEHPAIYSSGPTPEMYAAYDREVLAKGGYAAWDGEWPGKKECRERGWWCRSSPPNGDSLPCYPDAPGAHEDLRRRAYFHQYGKDDLYLIDAEGNMPNLSKKKRR